MDLLLHLLDLLTMTTTSWRFWLSTLTGLAIGRVIEGSFMGWWPAMLTVCGIFAGLVWAASTEKR